MSDLSTNGITTTPINLDAALARLVQTPDDGCSARELALKELVREFDRTTEQLGSDATYEDFLVDRAHRLTTFGYR